ncbi:DinB family protein [Rossellomorea oryzaecorticis]|uniref:DinB family protein n=1 Tax=Rossellomorea oryzaecorticis TaxID=1396505 RepID=A0ABU9K9V9_9BACI
MNERRESIVLHHQEMVLWVESLNSISKEEWFRPIEESKWSIAEVISHFVPWDEFIMNKRLPYLGSSDPLPPAPDPQILNEQSASKGRASEQSAVIQSFIETRNRLATIIQEIPEGAWQQLLQLGEKELTLTDYLEGLSDHDLHHKHEIERVLAKQNAQN